MLKSLICLSLFIISCRQKDSAPDPQTIKTLNLKHGKLVQCGPPESKFGTVNFDVSCSKAVREDIDMALALLHSFEYDESEKIFSKVIKTEPGCAIAYWGVAMTSYHPLWAPPTISELGKGAAAIELARSISVKTERETDYINATGAFYKGWQTTSHRQRAIAFEKAMADLNKKYPDDKETAIFYALALDAAADPTDTSFANQKKAGDILNALYPGQPEHPGIVHYIIHTYDYPSLAAAGLIAARKYASIAPSSAHAQHMPSHIFTRLGLWDECITSNKMAIASAICYAENAGLKGHWDEELHGLDYLMYGYLQKGDNKNAKAQYDYLKTIKEVAPVNFKVSYAFAAIPARYFLENKNWSEACKPKLLPANFNWQDFPWQESIYHFANAMSFANTGQVKSAQKEADVLRMLRDTLLNQKNQYHAIQVDIQVKTSDAWINFRKGHKAKGLELMIAAADLEDRIEKHPVSPGEVIPARELLGEMLLELNKPEEALIAFELDLKRHPNRFNGVYGAAVAAEKSNDLKKATDYYTMLIKSSVPDSDRKELKEAKSFIAKNGER